MVILLLGPRGDYSELTYAFIQVTALGHGERVLGSRHVGFASSTKSSCSPALFRTKSRFNEIKTSKVRYLLLYQMCKFQLYSKELYSVTGVWIMIQTSVDVYFRGAGIVPQASLIRCAVQLPKNSPVLPSEMLWDNLCVLQTLLQSHMGVL